MSKKQLKKRDFLKELSAVLGIVSIACDNFGISRQTFYRWKREDVEFSNAVADIAERSIDYVESCLVKGIREGDARLIMFYLNNKGKKRGYGLRNANDENKQSITLRISGEEAEY